MLVLLNDFSTTHISYKREKNVVFNRDNFIDIAVVSLYVRIYDVISNMCNRRYDIVLEKFDGTSINPLSDMKEVKIRFRSDRRI